MYSTHEAGLRKIYSSYRSRAYRKKIPFELTTEEFVVIITSACYYCGIGPERVISRDYADINAFVCGTIDRIDSGGPYAYQNCRPACWTCNRAKGELTDYAFFEWVRRIANRFLESSR